MSVFKSKTIFIIILTCYGIIMDSAYAYIAALIVPLTPLEMPVISSALTLLGFVPQVVQGEPIAIILMIATVVIHIFYHGLPWKNIRQQCTKNTISSKYLIFIYLITFSFLSLSNFTPSHYTYLLCLYLLLILYSLTSTTTNHLRYCIYTFSILSIIWGISIKIFSSIYSRYFQRVRHWGNQQWWYYVMLCFSSWIGVVLCYQIQYEKIYQSQLGDEDDRGVSHRRNFSNKADEEDMIEMRVISRQSANAQSFHHIQQQFKVNENFSEGSQKHQSRRNILPPLSKQLQRQFDRQQVQKFLAVNQDMDLRKHRQLAKSDQVTFKFEGTENEKQKQKSSVKRDIRMTNSKIRSIAKSKFRKDNDEPELEGMSYSAHLQQQSQEQITNLFLLIPFTLFQPSFLQIPIYLYLIWLQTGRTPTSVFYIMFFSICLITFLEKTASLKMQIALRICLILIVNKNFKWAINITRVLRSIWLRSSFVFVLLVLFWFSLLTVNVFHISFVVIVLLFITKNNNEQSQQPSFRHRNWKYLILIFNVFLILRLLWIIFRVDIGRNVPTKVHDILSIIGITYNYGLQWPYFNLIPLLVSGVLTIQYWTYSSRIYDMESKKTLQFLPTYRTFILKLLQIFTIVYYKLIPWASHFMVIIILISLQFSLIADLVLIWSLFILMVHMSRPNQLSAYKTMYRMWNVFLKLVSIQIILRYFFQFIKFPLIFSHISQFPIINTLISYQELFGLAIRESTNAYIKNVFTKFQLMMILDFSIIAVSFLTIEYYDIMIKYYELRGIDQEDEKSQNQLKQSKEKMTQKIQLILPDQQSQLNKPLVSNRQDKKSEPPQSLQSQGIKNSHTITAHDAVYIYQNYIDFKLTKWLQSFNQLMLIFSKMFLKLYYPFLGTYSCLYYSYATMAYFLITVYYYLKINLKFYQLYAVNQVQLRIMKLFHLWRLQNNIRVNLVQKEPIRTDQIIKPKDQTEMAELQKRLPAQLLQEWVNSGLDAQKTSTSDLPSLYRQLKKEITVINFNILFDNFIGLHRRLRFWILMITMSAIALNYTSRLLLTHQIKTFLNQSSIEQWRYLLFMCGTSIESPISIKMYLLIIALTVLQIKCCSLASKIGRQKPKQQNENNNQGQKDLHHLKQSEHDILSRSNTPRKNEANLAQSKQVQKFIDVSISLRLGLNKIMQRFFVILLVFVSLLQNQNPFSIIYLVCAWFLNYLGTKSIQTLSITLTTLIILQYSLIITDTTNMYLDVSSTFPDHIHHSWLIQLFGVHNEEWIKYLTFGNRLSQIFVMYLSLIILMMYQLCFYIQEFNWIQILDKMFQKITIGGIYLKFYQKISQVYQYALVYSPLFIITLCLGLYLMDFTATNMFLSILSIIFLFKSFLLQNYTNSRPFWKSYFRILQLLIIIFMVIYCILITPMYNKYCNKVLCSPQQFRTKITKTILLLILQIGIDLISSHHFINAMNTLENTLNQTSSFYRIAISIVQNDKKIEKSFQSIRKKESVKRSLVDVREFLGMYETDGTVRFDNRRQIDIGNQSWLDTILNFMPSFIDSSLIKGPEQTRNFVRQQNKQFIEWLEQKNKSKLSEQQMKNINQLYINEFVDNGQSTISLRRKLQRIIDRSKHKDKDKDKQVNQKLLYQSNKSVVRTLQRERKTSFNNDVSYDDLFSQGNSIRKSYIQGIMPYEQQSGTNIGRKPTNRSIKQEEQMEMGQNIMRRSSRMTLAQQLSDANQEEKKKILYLKIFQSVVSNWHYLTYTLMILQFVINMGLLTLPFPILTFTLGIVHSYQAPKSAWRLAFLALLPPIFFKYSLQIELFKPSPILEFILIGSNSSSILIQYLLMFFIVVQCLILKIAGLYDQSTAQVQCMNIALIRNILNVDQNNKTKQEERQAFFTLLQKSKQPSSSFFEYLFSSYQCKFGYDYSTLMVTIQLIVLVYIFCFYDRMAVRQELTFYKMIEYNQFTTGMVIMAFIQLGFILLDRIMTVLELSYKKWDITLIMKYIVMIVSLIYVHTMVLAFFPINSGHFGSNRYVIVFYILHIFYFLISALQIKVGLNKQSRGFMDRYTWYNGYIYMFYRAIPFLFQFKVFSDWTFTKTSLRLFDWIKYQEILGYLYVAKCNSLFLRGKILGSKIQWWKKLLMGFPLLLTIILLLFGPLILFSSLNPLASLNQITGGYLQLSLKINKTNEYPFYINTHITDISFLDTKPDKELEQVIKTYELDQRSIQIVHLQPFSDQYWQISQGSYKKLIDEPPTSLYQLTMRVKFDRNETKTTPVYVLNTYTIPLQRVQQFKDTLMGKGTFLVDKFVPAFMRLDNNNGLHYLTDERFNLMFHAEESRTLKKKYWVIDKGITFKMASDKYSKAIFGYSVMSFYISIILVVANYFRFLFQGSAYTIIMSDIPYADPILSICDGIYQARLRGDIYEQQMLFWTLIDIIRSPDLMKAITGNYLNARIETLQLQSNPQTENQQDQKKQTEEKSEIKQRRFLKKDE